MQPSTPDVAAYILAGGKSTRMGSDKAFVTLNGRTLLARALDIARALTQSFHIVGDPVKFAPFAPAIDDIFPECGPLAGIHAALRSSPADLNVLLAVDEPFLSLTLLEYLISRARKSPSAAVIVPRASGRLQPLCAVYRREFADFAEQALRAGRYKIDALFSECPTEVIAEEELEAVGFSPRIFRNVNTPEDLAEAAR